MHKIPRTIKEILAIVAFLATTSMGVSAALAGYGGYEYSQ